MSFFFFFSFSKVTFHEFFDLEKQKQTKTPHIDYVFKKSYLTIGLVTHVRFLNFFLKMEA